MNFALVGSLAAYGISKIITAQEMQQHTLRVLAVLSSGIASCFYTGTKFGKDINVALKSLIVKIQKSIVRESTQSNSQKIEVKNTNRLF